MVVAWWLYGGTKGAARHLQLDLRARAGKVAAELLHDQRPHLGKVSYVTVSHTTYHTTIRIIGEY